MKNRTGQLMVLFLLCITAGNAYCRSEDENERIVDSFKDDYIRGLSQIAMETKSSSNMIVEIASYFSEVKTNKNALRGRYESKAIQSLQFSLCVIYGVETAKDLKDSFFAVPPLLLKNRLNHNQNGDSSGDLGTEIALAWMNKLNEHGFGSILSSQYGLRIASIVDLIYTQISNDDRVSNVTKKQFYNALGLGLQFLKEASSVTNLYDANQMTAAMSGVNHPFPVSFPCLNWLPGKSNAITVWFSRAIAKKPEQYVPEGVFISQIVMENLKKDREQVLKLWKSGAFEIENTKAEETRLLYEQIMKLPWLQEVKNEKTENNLPAANYELLRNFVSHAYDAPEYGGNPYDAMHRRASSYHHIMNWVCTAYGRPDCAAVQQTGGEVSAMSFSMAKTMVGHFEK